MSHQNTDQHSIVFRIFPPLVWSRYGDYTSATLQFLWYQYPHTYKVWFLTTFKNTHHTFREVNTRLHLNSILIYPFVSVRPIELHLFPEVNTRLHLYSFFFYPFVSVRPIELHLNLHHQVLLQAAIRPWATITDLHGLTSIWLTCQRSAIYIHVGCTVVLVSTPINSTCLSTKKRELLLDLLLASKLP